MPSIGSKLGDEVQLIELAGRAFIPALLKGVDNRLMICKDSKMYCFNHVPEIFDSFVDS
jgi:hypothetical protein